MNAPTTFATLPDSPAPDPAADPSHTLRDRQLARLDRLAEAGMEMIETLVAQAKGVGPKVVEGDVGLAFGRVSRAVRLAVLLLNELTAPEGDAGEAARQDEVRRRKEHTDRAVRIVKRVAQDYCEREPFEVSVIAREAAERLEDDDIYSLVASRPVGELVALICRDFGLEPDWDVLAEEAWAKAEIASGSKGSPFLDDEDWEDGPEDAAAPDPPQVRCARSFDEALLALAQDPQIIAAARRESG